MLNVIQNNREHIPSPCTPRELRKQLLALHDKLLLCAVGAQRDALGSKLRDWRRHAKESKDAVEVGDVVFAVQELEALLSQQADAINSGEAFAESLDLDEWQTDGHEYIGKRLQRVVRGADGAARYVHARVVGWLPPPPPPYKADTSRPSLRTNWTRLVQVAACRDVGLQGLAWDARGAVAHLVERR